MQTVIDPAAGWRVNELELHSYTTARFLTVDVKRAWNLDGILHDIPMRDLEFILDESSWGGASPRRCAHLDPHWSLILEADLSYPILITAEPGEKFEVVDGRHRVVKAWLLGLETVRAKLISYETLATAKTNLPAVVGW